MKLVQDLTEVYMLLTSNCHSSFFIFVSSLAISDLVGGVGEEVITNKKKRLRQT